METAVVERERYACEVREVFSGDDLIVLVNLGVDNLWKKVRLRLHGVDTPNAAKAGKDTEAGKVRSYVRSIARNRPAVLTVVAKTANSWIGNLEVESATGSIDLNKTLIELGHVYKR